MTRLIFFATLLAASGCQGLVGAIGGGGAGDPDSTSSALCQPVKMPALARLTRTQYRDTLYSLLGVSVDVTTFPPDDDSLGFAVGSTTSTLLVKRIAAAAESAAAGTDVVALAGCSTIDEPCARAFIARLGRRAFREPLQSAVVERLLAVFRQARTAGDSGEDALRLLLRAMLQSPRLVYRRHRPAAQRAFSVASRLSYFLWGTPPDAALLDLAEHGGLDAPDKIAARARAMLADKRADRTISDFFSQWLSLDRLDSLSKDTSVYRGFDRALAASMKRETEAFAHEVMRNTDATLRTLLTAPFTLVDDRMAKHYGFMVGGHDGDGSASGGGATAQQQSNASNVAHRVELDPERRGGLLTQATFLAINANTNQSSPIRRGRFVRERLLCQDLPPPPDNVVATPPDPDPSLPTRERFEQHRTDPACSSCHQLMDPIGFGFERFDGVGRYRDSEAGKPIDDSGTLSDTVDIDGTFHGVPDLARELAGSAQVQRCMVKQWFRYAFGRRETGYDACAIRQVQQRFVSAKGDLRELVVAIATLLATADDSAGDPKPPAADAKN